MLEKYEDYDKSLDYVKDIQQKKGLNRNDALRYLSNNIPKENYYQTRILKALHEKYPAAYVVKIQQGSYSTAGIPDVLFIRNGKCFFFEVKRPVFGALSKLQEKTINIINNAGVLQGLYRTLRKH